MTVTVGEMRSQCAYQDGSTPVIIISNDKQLKDLKLRVVAFYPDHLVKGSNGERVHAVFKIKIEVDDFREPK